MTRRIAIKRLEAIAGLRASIRSEGATVAHRLARRPAAPRDAGASYELVLEHMHDELLALERQLKTSEDNHDHAKARFQECKRQREQATSDLGRKHRQIKRFLKGFYQSQTLARAGLDRTVSPAGPVFISQVARTINVLHEVETLGPTVLNLDFDAPAMAVQLEVDLGQLEASVADLETARASVVATRGRASEVIAEIDRVVPWIGRCLASLCRLAGEQPPAKRNRSR